MNFSQSITRSLTLCVAIPAFLFCIAPHASASLVTEYFNAYGTGYVALDYVGSAGNGWANGWVDDAGATSTVGAWPSYQPNTTTWPSFDFVNANYNGSANGTAATDGQARGGQNAGTVVERSFSTGLTGTVWVSALVNCSVAQDVLLWLDQSSVSAGPFIALRYSAGKLVPRMRAGGSDMTSDTTGYATGTTWLFLAKLVINDSGSSDSMQFWIKGQADDLSSEAALGSAIYTKSGVDIFGSSIDKIGLSFGGVNARLDAIRLSNDENALQQVLGTVPEPASLALLSLGALALLRRKRN